METEDRQPTRAELDEALAYYRRALETNPGDEIMWMLYGNTLCAVEDYEEAVKAYEKASGGKRPLPEVHYLLGVARMSAGDFGGAVEAFERHLKRSQDVEVLVLASLCLDVEDDRARSKAFFDEAVRRDSGRAMEYLREYAQELAQAEGGEGGDPGEMRVGLQNAISHIDDYLKERKGAPGKSAAPTRLVGPD